MSRTCSLSSVDIEAMLRPISDDCRGGDSSTYARWLRQELSELRNPPRSANPDDPEQDGGIDPIDWHAVLRKATDALTTTTKDLRVACHLTEAALNLYGLSGLRDGLQLLHRFVQEYWEDLAPALDPSDPETRCAPLENLLNDPVHGPRMPTTLRSLELLRAGELKLSLLTAMRPTDEMTAASIASAVRQIPVDQACQLSDDLDSAIQTLEALQQELIERMSDYAPSFNHLSESLSLIRRWFDTALKDQLRARSEGDKTTPENTTSPSASSRDQGTTASDIAPSASLVDQSLRIRADAYRQLTDAANVLQRMEPHSPIPYMIHRAVSLGQLPFPKLMSQWIKEESTLEMFCRELGLSQIDATESGDGK